VLSNKKSKVEIQKNSGGGGNGVKIKHMRGESNKMQG